MNPYAFCLCLGGAGLLAMASGAAFSMFHMHGHGPHADAPGSMTANLAGRGARGVGRGGFRGPGLRGVRGARARDEGGLTSLLSPRVLFSVLMGVGVTGLLGHGRLHAYLVAILAIVGGVAFERLLVRPFWDFLLRFASAPALTLESVVMETARAVTNFDARGQGLVAIELDGQVVQVLATLRASERDAGARVVTGDALLIEEVDAARNRCTVSRAKAHVA